MGLEVRYRLVELVGTGEGLPALSFLVEDERVEPRIHLDDEAENQSAGGVTRFCPPNPLVGFEFGED